MRWWRLTGGLEVMQASGEEDIGEEDGYVEDIGEEDSG